MQGLNKEVLARIVGELGLQTLTDKSPLDLVPTIQPVLISNPERIVDVVESKTTGGTVYTTPTDRDFFLTGCQVSCTAHDQDLATVNSIDIVMMNGATKRISSVTAGAKADTAGSNASSQTFTPPIKLKRGSVIAVTKNSSTTSFIIIGYTVDIL